MSRRMGRLFRSAVAVGLLFAAGRGAAQADLPTAELDPHFKGGRGGHEYTLAMLELGMRMGAATTAALQDDSKHALAALKSFREQYVAVSRLVPSWKDHFREAPIADLEGAVGSKADLAARRKLVDRIERGCTDCHARYMFPVQARYRWGDFSTATVPDEKGGSLTFHQLMLDLANSLGAVRGDVEAGRFQEAWAAYQRLADRFGSMELLCVNCHDQPRQYFIDASVKGRIYRIGGLLRRGERNVAEYAPMFKDINEQSCLPCHQVHMPAAFRQAYLREGK